MLKCRSKYSKTEGGANETQRAKQTLGLPCHATLMLTKYTTGYVFCVSAGTSDIFQVQYIWLPLIFILRRFKLRVNYSSVAQMVGS